MNKGMLFRALAIVIIASSLLLGVPRLLNYQGKLYESSLPVTGSRAVGYRLYRGTSLVWSQSPSDVSVSGGLFSDQLDFSVGYETGESFSSVFGSASVCSLEVYVGPSGSTTFGECTALSPKERLMSAPYAFNVADGMVNDNKIDWGSGTDQVSAVDMPIEDAGGYYTTDNVEAALQELGAGGSGNYVQLSPSSVQTDADATSSIWLNRTTGSGNLLELQSSGGSRLTFTESGSLTLNNAGVSNMLTLQDAGATKFAVSPAGNILAFYDSGDEKKIDAPSTLTMESDVSVVAMIDADDDATNAQFRVRHNGATSDLFIVHEYGGATVGQSVLFTPQSGAPAQLDEGRVYYNDSTDKLRLRTSTGWEDLTTGSGSQWTDNTTYIYANDNTSARVYDNGQNYGFYIAGQDTGVYSSGNEIGVYGYSASGTALYGKIESASGYAVVGYYYGSGNSSGGVRGLNANNGSVIGVLAYTDASGNDIGVYGTAPAGGGSRGYAGYFSGNVLVTDTLFFTSRENARVYSYSPDATNDSLMFRDSYANSGNPISLKKLYDAATGSTPNWDAVLTTGNSAGSNDVNINSNDVLNVGSIGSGSDVLNVTDTSFVLDSDNSASDASVVIWANQGLSSNGGIRYSASDDRWEVTNDGGTTWEPLASGGYVSSVTEAGSGALTISPTTGDVVIGVKTDGTTIGVNGSDQLYIPDGGVNTAQLAADAVNDAKIDWGTGANQVSAVDVPYDNSTSGLSATDVQNAIDEVYDSTGATDLQTAYNRGNTIAVSGSPVAISGGITGATSGQLTVTSTSTSGNGIYATSPSTSASRAAVRADATGSGPAIYAVSGTGPAIHTSGDIQMNSGDKIYTNANVIIDVDDDGGGANYFRVRNGTDGTIFNVDENADVTGVHDITASGAITATGNITTSGDFYVGATALSAGGATTPSGASLVGYYNTVSGLSATDVQGAIDEIDGTVDDIVDGTIGVVNTSAPVTGDGSVASPVTLNVGTGLNTSGGNLNVSYGAVASTAVEGNETATITAGSGLAGGISGDALGDGFSATLNVGTTSNDGITVNADDIAVNVDDATIELSSDALRVKADGINDTHIDWGTGANQVSAVDVPIADAGGIITATEVEGALQENRQAIDALEAGTGNVISVTGGAGLSPDAATTGAVTVALKYDDVTIGVNGSDQAYLKDDAVTTGKIADGQVMTADIANGDVTQAKLDLGSGDANVNADDMDYRPAVLADWSGGVDPGSAEDGLDQLASRTDDIEDGVGNVISVNTFDGAVTISEGSGIDITNSDPDVSIAYNASEAEAANEAVLDHNDLQGIQGGAAGDYYHLTQSDYNTLTNADASRDDATSEHYHTGTSSATYTLNDDVTGAPSENVSLVVERGTSSDVSLRWNETLTRWEYTNNGSTWNPIGAPLWNDAGNYLEATTNTDARVYDDGQSYGYYYNGANGTGFYGVAGNTGVLGRAGTYGVRGENSGSGYYGYLGGGSYGVYSSGPAYVGGSLTITGKATSASTAGGDAATTLTTKDYVDGLTGPSHVVTSLNSLLRHNHLIYLGKLHLLCDLLITTSGSNMNLFIEALDIDGDKSILNII